MKQIFFSIIVLVLFGFSRNLQATDYTECTVLEDDNSGDYTLRSTVSYHYNIGEEADCPPTYSTMDVEFDQVLLICSDILGCSNDIDKIDIGSSTSITFDNQNYNLILGNWAQEAIEDVTASPGFVYTEDEIAGIDDNWGSVVIDATDLDEGELPFTCTEGTKVFTRNLFINTNKVYTLNDFGDCGINAGYTHICGGEIYKSDPWNYVDQDYYFDQDYYNSIKNSLWTPEEEEETGTTSGGTAKSRSSASSKTKVISIGSVSSFGIATYYNVLGNHDTQITYGPNVAGWCDQDADDDGYETHADGDESKQDCNDWESSIYPGSTEYCDGVDNDCDSQIDEEGSSDATIWYEDNDEDGYGDSNSSKTACSQPSGDYVENNDDCNDDNDDLNPGATEVCDGVDNDCDGEADEDSESATYYYDADGDGYGVTEYSLTSCNPDDATGYSTVDGDCDDTDPSINPGEKEICAEEDTVDEDCNDAMGCEDSACSSEDYCEEPETPEVDADGDGYNEDEDCDDKDADVNPGMSEVCGNDKDDDCDGSEDEGNTHYFDSDGDDYGDPQITDVACEQPTSYVSDSSDCNDLDGGVNPAAAEICDNDVDDNCDDLTDEEDTIVCPQKTEIEKPNEEEDEVGDFPLRGGPGGCQINGQSSFNLTALFFILIFLLTLQVARRGKRG